MFPVPVYEFSSGLFPRLTSSVSGLALVLSVAKAQIGVADGEDDHERQRMFRPSAENGCGPSGSAEAANKQT